MTTETEGEVTIAVAQMRPVIDDKDATLRRSLALIAEAAGRGARIIVLPELTSSGCVFRSRAEAFALAEPVPDGPTTRAWAEAAAAHGAIIMAGIAERDGARLFNSAVVVEPEGFLGVFRKVHLWGADAEGIFIAAPYVTGIESAKNAKFLAAMKAEFGDKLETPNDLSTPQYEAISACRAAVEKVWSTDPQKIIDALDDVAVVGPRGVIQMNDQRHASLTTYLGQVAADGSMRVIQTFPNVDPGEQCPNLG